MASDGSDPWDTTCACVSRNAYECAGRRRRESPQDLVERQEGCECSCHDDDPDVYDEVCCGDGE